MVLENKNWIQKQLSLVLNFHWRSDPFQLILDHVSPFCSSSTAEAYYHQRDSLPLLGYHHLPFSKVGQMDWKTGGSNNSISILQHNRQHILGKSSSEVKRHLLGMAKITKSLPPILVSSGLELNHSVCWNLCHFTGGSGLNANLVSTPWTWWCETVICDLAKDAQFGNQMTWHEGQEVVISSSKSSPGLLTMMLYYLVKDARHSNT